MKNTVEVKKATKVVKTTTNAPAKKVAKATNAVKEITDTVDFTDSINKVKETAQVVNNEIKVAATEIAKDIKEMSQDIRTVATKGVKEVSKKVNFKGSVKTAKKTAKTVNTQLKATANVIAEDVKEMRKELGDVTTKLAKEAVESINVTERINYFKQAAKNANQYALEAAEDMIKGFETNGEKWQNVAEKAIKTGLKMAEKQEKLMFTTLDAVKTQVTGTALRFKKLFQ
jgi:D-ribose pyranose/furanose isomerase RbsD